MNKQISFYLKSMVVPVLLITGLCAFAIHLSWELAHGEELTILGIVGGEIWIYAAIAILGIVCFLLVGLNIIKARAIQMSSLDIKKSNKLLESRLAAIELALNGIFIVDKEGQLTYMNKRFMELQDIEQKNASTYLGQDWIGLLSIDAQTEIQTEVAQALHAQNSWCREIKMGENNEKYVELSITKLPDSGLIGTCRDISSQQKAHQEKEELQSQFYQAQKMEAIGRLAGGIAHDFNNILAAINGYAEFLVEDLEDRPPQQKFANKILSATQQAKKLVDQILTFSRRNDTKSEIVDIISLVAESTSMIKASSIGTIDITKDFTVDRAVIDGNSTQISQAVMNLCVNAMDAMEDGHGTLSVSVKPIDVAYIEKLDLFVPERADKVENPISKIEEINAERTILTSGTIARLDSYVCISVQDTGTGMSRIVMEHVFEPFFTTKPVDKGTGLGLATVHGVVTQHNGAIIIDSTLGKGTTFHLCFPLSEGFQTETQGSPQKLGRFEFEGARLLLVEDEQTVRDMTTKMLQRMGFEVITANDGDEGLEKLRTQGADRPFHLVLTDHSMPKKTGLEMILEAESQYPNMPFVLLSGYSEKKLQDIMEDHPAIKAVLRKPIAKEALKHQIYTALSEAYDDLESNVF